MNSPFGAIDAGVFTGEKPLASGRRNAPIGAMRWNGSAMRNATDADVTW